MPRAPRTLEQYMFSGRPIEDGDRFFSGHARVARLFLANRFADKRTNAEICAAVNLGHGNVISLLLKTAIGDVQRSPVSDDALLSLAREVGCEALLPAMAILLLEDWSPISASILLDGMAKADPHIVPLRTLVVAMADGIVAVPPGTNEGVAIRVREARERAERDAAAWVETDRQLRSLWRARDDAGEPVALYGDEGHRLMAIAEEAAAPTP